MSFPFKDEDFESNLGEFARWQIEQARSDDRRSRGRGAMIADFHNAMEEAERMRELMVHGLYCSKEGPAEGDEAGLAQAKWEVRQLAEAEIENEYPHLSAMALISMHSALDAMVEELVPSIAALSIWEGLREEVDGTEEALGSLDESKRRDAEAAIMETIAARLRSDKKRRWKLRGDGAERYESLLRRVGLDGDDDRLPEDLTVAMVELSAIRDVIVHRAGRIDQMALRVLTKKRVGVLVPQFRT